VAVGFANGLGVGAVERRTNEAKVVVNRAYLFNNPVYLLLILTQAHFEDLINRFVHPQTVHEKTEAPGHIGKLKRSAIHHRNIKNEK
ncbi:uncharacterized protein METZ01_LOCUS318143, partial [marine metagenome]